MDILTECIEWSGKPSSQGYGRKRVGGKLFYAHRWTFIQHHGREPEGVLRHICDNRMCVNVDHLIEGSKADNSRDMVERGRSLRGESQPHSKLTLTQVEEIRHSTDKHREIAARYGIARQTVGDIKNGKSWSYDR